MLRGGRRGKLLTRFKDAMENEEGCGKQQQDVNPGYGDVEEHEGEDPGEDEYQANAERYERQQCHSFTSLFQPGGGFPVSSEIRSTSCGLR